MIDHENIVLGPARTWSFSALMNYEKCPHIIKQKLDRAPVPERDENHPAERGTKIHDMAEKYVDGTYSKFPADLRKFKNEFDELRSMYPEGNVILEEDWGFTLNWAPTGWTDDDTWNRMKLDALVLLDEGTAARVIDYKTGKKFGNEVKHMQQAQLYAIGVFFKYPNVQALTTEFWYLDHKLTTRKTYTREKMLHYITRFTERALAMTTTTVFPPKPNKMNCKWCDYGNQNGTGVCAFAYEE